MEKQETTQPIDEMKKELLAETLKKENVEAFEKMFALYGNSLTPEEAKDIREIVDKFILKHNNVSFLSVLSVTIAKFADVPTLHGIIESYKHILAKKMLREIPRDKLMEMFAKHFRESLGLESRGKEDNND